MRRIRIEVHSLSVAIGGAGAVPAGASRAWGYLVDA